MPFKFKTSVSGIGSGNSIRPNEEYSADELDAMVPDWRNYLKNGMCEAVNEEPEKAVPKPKTRKRTTAKTKTTAG